MCYGLFVEHLDTLHMYCIGADESNYDYEKLELPDGYRQNVIYPIVDDVLFQGLHGKRLEKKFAELLIEERKIHDSVGIDYFGFKYSELLDKYEISNVNILKLAGLSEKYATEIGKGKKLYRIVKDDSEGLNEKKATMMSFKMSSQKEPSNSIDDNHCVFNPSQTIFYGVPGCGKSNKIREQLKNVPEKNKVRVVFHPEYTNAEFIGQILPVTNDGIRYEFTPGPFTQIIKRAYLNPNEQFYLVIEEINRGNAAAIFGDTFQLLDRLKVGETDSLGNDPANAAVNTFTEGWSQYFVQNDDVNAYIRGTENSIQIGNIRFDSNTAIRLPPNLSILATMNTSDQNVFTLDNAFQRRFDMELVRNEFDLTKPAVNAQYEAEIDDTGIKWGQFWGWINAKITATLKGLSSTEDKRLGVWFVSNVDGIIDDKIFAEKVLKFLWDDVFKFKRPQIFAKDVDTLEKLINFFENPPEGKERFDVFDGKADLKAFEASPTL